MKEENYEHLFSATCSRATTTLEWGRKPTPSSQPAKQTRQPKCAIDTVTWLFLIFLAPAHYFFRSCFFQSFNPEASLGFTFKSKSF